MHSETGERESRSGRPVQCILEFSGNCMFKLIVVVVVALVVVVVVGSSLANLTIDLTLEILRFTSH